MFRKFLPAVAVFLLAVPAAAQPVERSLLMPGVSYSRAVEFTSHGPVVFHVVNGPRPTGLYGLRPALSQNALAGTDTLSAIERQASAQATVAGINGDLFAANGQPSGLLLRAGVLESGPAPGRTSAGITSDGTLQVARVTMAGIWKGTGQRRPLVLNQQPGKNGVSLFTPAFGATTPAGTDVVEAVLTPFPAAAPGTDLTSVVVQIAQSTGGTPIPANGAVLVARGTGAASLAAEAPVGTAILVRLQLTPDWSALTDAIGGGPQLVKDGRAIFRANELFTSPQLNGRTPRSAVGQLTDGRIVLVAVDGGSHGYSVGMTNFELAVTMARLGAVTAFALNGGASTSLAFDGALLNRPSAGEPKIADALLLLYYGVYAAPVLEPVVSPNGDGVAEKQGLAYRVVRPTTVTATLVGPDRVPRPVDSGQRAPGVYRFVWPATRGDGTTETEGGWRFNVTGVDDRGQSSVADRLFSVNLTLGALAASPDVLSLGSGALRATYTLAHPARVNARVETATGVVVATLVDDEEQPGSQGVAWNGKDARGRLVFGGRYVLRVTATNDIGRTELTKTFSAQR